MKAALCTRYGPPEVLQLQDVDDPVPRAKDVLIRIRATTVTPSDCYIRSMIPSAPLITRFHVGDRVWAFTTLRMSCYAQRIRLPATLKLLMPAPSNLGHDEAAAVLGGWMGLYFLSKANIQSGQQVLVYGASGANGTGAMQFAKHLGARVTAVCSTANVELMRALGADAVLDYTKDQPSALGRYDVVFDAVGRRKTSPIKEASRNALTPAGTFISVDDRLPRFRRDDLMRLEELAEAGKLKPVIDRRYPLEQIAEAHRYVEQRHKKGNVVITIAD